jgi:hypothetical protein
MTSTDPKRLFNPGGCLTATTIRSYINGSLRLSAKLHVDEHLKKCQLCSEALEGYRSHARRTYVGNDLEYLSKRVRRKYSGQTHPLSGRLPTLIFFTVMAFLVGLMVVFYILKQNLPEQTKPAGTKSDTVMPNAADNVIYK